MARIKGSPKTGGRQKGSANKKTLEAQEILDNLGCNPMEILANIAVGNILPGLTDIPTMDQRRDSAKELMKYVYPQRKAVEHTGELDGQLTVQIVRFGDAS